MPTIRRTSLGTFERERERPPSKPPSRGAGGCDFAARPSLGALDQRVHWTPEANPAAVPLARAPDWPEISGPPLSLNLTEQRVAPEAIYARLAGGIETLPVIFLQSTATGAPLAAMIAIDVYGLDRAEALLRLLRRLAGLVGTDRRLTDYRRRRIPLELRAADARFRNATYREIATAFHGSKRLALEADWRSSALRTEAIDLAKGGKALIAGGYRKLFVRRRRL